MTAESYERSPRRVAILDHTACLGGGEIALLNLARRIDPRQYDVVVVLFCDGPLRAKLIEHGIETLVIELDSDIADTRKDSLGGKSLLQLGKVMSMGRFIRRLARELRRNDFDLIHTNSLKSDILGGVAGRWAGIPVVWHVRDRIADDYLPRSVAIAFRILTRLIPQRVIANSYATLSTLRFRRSRETPPSSDSRLVVVHDGTEVGPMQPVVDNGDRLIVGLVGRISPWKGQHVFLRAISLIKQQFPQARFQIIGSALFSESNYEQEIRSLSTSLELDDVVDFMGFRDDVPRLVERMDLLVHASTIGEPFGQVILEGMAAGRAVIATRGGGVPEFVQDGVTGILIPMNDTAAMAAAMTQLLGDQSTRLEMGRRARQHVLDGFTIQHTADKVQRLYAAMLQVLPSRSSSDAIEEVTA